MGRHPSALWLLCIFKVFRQVARTARQAGPGRGFASCRPLQRIGRGRSLARLCDLPKGGPGAASPLTVTELGGASVVSRGLAGDPAFCA